MSASDTLIDLEFERLQRMKAALEPFSAVKAHRAFVDTWLDGFGSIEGKKDFDFRVLADFMGVRLNVRASVEVLAPTIMEFFAIPELGESVQRRFRQSVQTLDSAETSCWIGLSTNSVDLGWSLFGGAVEPATQWLPNNRTRASLFAWMEDEGIEVLESLHMSALVPANVGLLLRPAGFDVAEQLISLQNAFSHLAVDSPRPLFDVLEAEPPNGLSLSVVLTTDGLAGAGIVCHEPSPGLVEALHDLAGLANHAKHSQLRSTLGVEGPKRVVRAVSGGSLFVEYHLPG